MRTRRGHRPSGTASGGHLGHAELTAGTVIAGRYRVLRALGHGETSSVYEVEHEVTSFRSALRTFRPDLAHASFVLARAMTEITAPAQIDHPRIAPVLDAGQDEEHGVFITTPLFEGTLLSAHEPQRDPFFGINVILELLDPLVAAHERGLCHRALKPDHVLVTAAEPEGERRVVLVDFGRAILTGPVHTRPRLSRRSVRYMSPEQVAGEELTTASDVWAVGAILYELLARSAPFDGESAQEVAARILNASGPPPLAERAAWSIPPGVEEVVEQCLARDPNQRPRDAAVLRGALRWAAFPR